VTVHSTARDSKAPVIGKKMCSLVYTVTVTSVATALPKHHLYLMSRSCLNSIFEAESSELRKCKAVKRKEIKSLVQMKKNGHTN
jgi:hypothetical protein